MRILHLITRMDGGGSAAETLLLATEQLKLGHHVVLVMGLSEESEMSADELHGVEENLAAFRVLGGAIRWLPSLKRSPGIHDWLAYRDISALMNDGFDLVHTHTSKAGVLGRLAAGNRIKTVHSPHGHIFFGYFGALKTGLFVTIERWMARRSDALIALTKAEMDDHLRLGIGTAEQWHIIPGGVDIESIRRQIDQVRETVKEPYRWDAVSVGRLVPIKGMDRLICAWVEVCRARPGAKLAIIGDGAERERLELLASELGITENIHFTGWTNPIPYLANARCFALLSRNEGMGRAVVEAFAASLPCVVSSVCGLSELVDDEVGCVVDADSAEEVAHALLTEWSQVTGENACARANRYSVKVMVDGFEQVYEQICHD